jgi:hypothetical protein
MQTIWKSIKRNPVILAALAIVALQVVEDWGNITQRDWFQNLFTMAIAFMAREFTVPANEVKEGGNLDRASGN